MTRQTLPVSEIQRLLKPYLTQPLEEAVLLQCQTYLELLLRWNARTNLTAVRSPEEIVRVHLGECLFAAQHLPAGLRTLLDFGSGAGFPGLPIQLAHPELQVTLGESQSKKAAFLREVVRTLGLRTQVVGARIESLPAAQQFDAVALRAVDNMAAALVTATERVLPGGWMVVLTSEAEVEAITAALPGFQWQRPIRIPQSQQRVVLLGQNSR